MTYGHSISVPTVSAATQRVLDRVSGTWGGYQAWRQLHPEKRLQLVEQALSTAA